MVASKEASCGSQWGGLEKVKNMRGDLSVLAKVPACKLKCSVAFKVNLASKHWRKGPKSFMMFLFSFHWRYIFIYCVCVCVLEGWGH